MKVKDIQARFNLELAAGAKGLDREVTGGYCGDLLSDVIANAKSGSVWLTVQAHQNILAVAVLKELAAIVLVNGHRPDDATKARAEEEGIPILLSSSTSCLLAGQLFNAGITQKAG
jgi:predicted transcriptional regulator